MCSSPDGYGQHLEHVGLVRVVLAGSSGFGVTKAPASSQTCCHLRSIAWGRSCPSRLERKSLRRRGPGEASARRGRVRAAHDKTESPSAELAPPAPHSSASSSSAGSRGAASRTVSVTSRSRSPVARSGRIGMCSSSFPTPPRSTAASSRSAASLRAELRRASTGAARRLLTRQTLRARARAYREAAPDAARRLRDEGVPERRAACGSSPRRGSAPTSRRSASSRFAQAAGIAGGELVVHGNNKSRRGARARRPRRARSSCSTRSRRSTARARGRRRAHARPRHARHRGRHARGDPDGPPRLEVRAHARRRARGARAARAGDREGLHVHIGSQLRDSRRRARRGRLDRRRSPRVPAPSSAGRRGRSTSAAASASPRPPSERELPIAEFAGDARRASSSAPARRRARRAAARPRARPLAHRRAGVTLYTRRRRQASAGETTPTSPSTAACPTTPARALRRPLHGPARGSRRRAARPLPTRSSASTASPATC